MPPNNQRPPSDFSPDNGTGVNDADYQTPFAFTGTIDKLTLTLEP